MRVALQWLKRQLASVTARHADNLLSSSAHPVDSGRKSRISLLVVGSPAQDCQALSEMAQQSNWDAVFAGTCDEALRALVNRQFAVVICDRDLAGIEWRRALDLLIRSAPDASVMLASPVYDDYLWQEVVQHGGYDVLPKPFQPHRTIHSIEHAWWSWKAAASGPPVSRRGGAKATKK